MTRKRETEGIIPSVKQHNHPRQRVLDLMQRMARATAFSGAALGLAAAESCSPLVCDPLPPPITCANPTLLELQSALSLTGNWVNRDGGPLQVRLKVQNHGRTTVNFSATVTLTGATLGEAVTASNSLDVFLVPAGATSITVGVSFDCSGTTDSMTVTLDVGATPVANASVPARITSP